MARVNLLLPLGIVLKAVVALALAGAARVDAQSATFTSRVDLVPLTVTVTDTAGKYVTGLTGDDFSVLEDGVRQPLSFFAKDVDVPVDLAIVLDMSDSMRADLPRVREGASGLVRKLRPDDRGAVFQVSTNARNPQPFTTDHAALDVAIRTVSTAGTTALYDGLYIVLKEFERERRAVVGPRRQVLVLLSDGLDTTSRLPFEDVVDLARRVGVNIYFIALSGDAALTPRSKLDGRELTAEYAMGTVARESGGRTFFPKQPTELPMVCSAIAQELASQYALGYTPVRPGGDGAFRHVTVQIVPQVNARARTRSGYYASGTPARR
jgi:Ca-activated chloride channel homolog